MIIKMKYIASQNIMSFAGRRFKLLAFFLFVLSFVSLNITFAYCQVYKKSSGGIYCDSKGAVIEKIAGNTVVIKLFKPYADIYLEQYRGKPGIIRLKCKNVYAGLHNEPEKAHLKIKSGKTQVLWRKKSVAMLEVNLKGKRSTQIKLKTHLPSPDKFTFAVIGDPQGKYITYKWLLDKVQKTDSIFLIVLGDLVEKGSVKEYRSYLKAIALFTLPVFHIPGNHDVVYGGRYRFLDYISPTDYSFDMGEFHFIMLDSSRWYLRESQWRWLERELKGNRNNLVFMHVPPFSPVSRYEKYTLTGEKQDKRLVALMKKYQVRAVFSGHIHGFLYEKREGVPYYISGGGGAELHLFGFQGGYYHFLLIDIDGDKFKVRVVKLYD